MSAFIFRCNEKTFQECLDRNLFGELEEYLPFIKQLDVGSSVFLYNTTNWNLYGIFKATSQSDKHIEPQAWGGKFPAQIKVKPTGKIVSIHIDKTKGIVSFKGIYPDPLLGEDKVEALSSLFGQH